MSGVFRFPHEIKGIPVVYCAHGSLDLSQQVIDLFLQRTGRHYDPKSTKRHDQDLINVLKELGTTDHGASIADSHFIISMIPEDMVDHYIVRKGLEFNGEYIELLYGKKFEEDLEKFRTDFNAIIHSSDPSFNSDAQKEELRKLQLPKYKKDIIFCDVDWLNESNKDQVFCYK
jgi:hypothetical protein